MSLIASSPFETLLGPPGEGWPGAPEALVHLERLPARAARYGTLASPLPGPVAAPFGPEPLWSHQADAIDLLRAGRSTAIATGTASGKSRCYQAVIGESVIDPIRPGTALLCFPTKALAQDQLRSLTGLGLPGLVAATYDGDTPPEARTWVRRHANAVLTNPEMLHCGLLPHHERWATFLMRLRYVVLDELHVLRGVFGSHVAHVLRRLRRLCARYGSSPTFVFTSATIGSPGRLASTLCGLPVSEVTDDGSPRGERLFALWNPPLVDSRLGTRASTNSQVASLVAGLVRDQHRTIAFCRSRKGTELVAAETRRRLPESLAASVRPYRGGYLASERRQIEGELFNGELRAVVATTALELGINIGGLDACVLNGFPGTIASLWQQAGRAGRSQQESLAILVAGDDQLDQYFMAHPHEVFSRPPEPAVVNPANPYVLDPHLACAAYEQPLSHDDERWWGDDLHDGVHRLVLGDRLKLRTFGPTFSSRSVRGVWAGRGWPSRGVGLRSGGGAEYRIVRLDGQLVGTVDESRAFDLVHPGAVYLHQGQAYKVEHLDLTERTATVTPADGAEYTVARSSIDVSILGVDRQRAVGGAELFLGDVEITSQITGYQRKDVFTRAVLGTEVLDLPGSCLPSRAFWYVVSDAVTDGAHVDGFALPGALHAAEHAAIGMLPLFTICDRWDVGGVSAAWLPDTGAPTIAIYDAYAGGAGIAELGFDTADRHLAATLDAIVSCGCDDGCPSCVQSPKCGNWNDPLDKAAAVRLLQTVLA